MNIRVTNMRPVTYGNLLAYFDLAIEDALVVKGMTFKRKTDDSAYYVQFPAKARMVKGTQEIAVDEKGFKIYDNDVDLFLEKNAQDKYTPSKAAWAVKDEILAQATEAYESSAGGRGTAAPKAKSTAKVGKAAARTVESDTTDDADEDEDSDLPF